MCFETFVLKISLLLLSVIINSIQYVSIQF